MANDIAVLSNKIYLPYSKELKEALAIELTYKIPNPRPGGKPITLRNYSVINNKLIAFPIGRTDLIPKSYKIIDKRSIIPVSMPEFSFKLRESQEEIYNILEDNYIINAKPGWGKTITALAIIKKLNNKTLIVTHTTKLRDQWAEEIKAGFKFSPSIIGSGKFSIHTPIVVSNIQTLVKHTQELRDAFGTIIIDECHHIPASTFQIILDKLSARYKIGLSGTLSRKDKKHMLIFDYISKKVYIPKKENVMEPLIIVYKTNIRIPGNHLIPWANRVNELTDRKDYRQVVKSLAIAQAERGHKVLVVSDRIKFLEEVSSDIENSICITSQTQNQKELENQLRDGTKNILFGSIGIYKEGISINQISSLVLATTISNEPLIVQLVGRIIRQFEGKLRPEVIDIVLDCPTGRKQFETRLRAYRSEQYEIRYLN
jgi:superfamily II DNA or RNA helicase